jgi:hypothetical protein
LIRRSLAGRSMPSITMLSRCCVAAAAVAWLSPPARISRVQAARLSGQFWADLGGGSPLVAMGGASLVGLSAAHTTNPAAHTWRATFASESSTTGDWVGVNGATT